MNKNNFINKYCETNNINCVICLSSLSKIKRKLPCGHLFCFNCIYEWESINHTCPLCRLYIGKPLFKWPIRCIYCNNVNCDNNHTEMDHSYIIEHLFD